MNRARHVQGGRLADRSVVQVGHRKDQVEIVPFQQTACHTELLESTWRQVRANGRVRRRPQEWTKIHLHDLPIRKLQTQPEPTEVFRGANVHGFLLGCDHFSRRVMFSGEKDL
jgi:hypothetical protein